MRIAPPRFALASLTIALAATGARAAIPTPIIEGPVTSTGGAFIQPPTIDLALVGYVSEEYFISGTATAYANVGPLERDGRWTVTPASSAPYKTRILVSTGPPSPTSSRAR